MKNKDILTQPISVSGTDGQLKVVMVAGRAVVQSFWDYIRTKQCNPGRISETDSGMFEMTAECKRQDFERWKTEWEEQKIKQD
jgi:hypothetical protein